MAVLFTDNFNRSDGGLGADWTEVSAGLAISSNAVKDTSNPAGGHVQKCNTQASDANYYVQMDLTNSGGTWVSNYIFGRWNGNDPWVGGDVDMYWFTISNDGSWSLKARVDGNDVATIASGGAGSITDLTNPHTFKLSMNGTTINMYRDGVLLGGGTDSNLSATGYAGIAGGYNSGSSTVTIDNFEIGDFITASSQNPVYTGIGIYC